MTNVAMIGLGFGAEFIPIYQAHPDATVHAICRRNEAELHKVGDQFGIEHRYTDYDDVLADPGRRLRPHQHADSGPRLDVAGRARRRQARHVHRSHGDDRRRLPEDRPEGRENQPQVHDGRDRRLQPRVPVHQGALREGRTGRDPASRRLAPAGHGRMAVVLGADDPDALRDPRRQPLPGAGRRVGRVRELLRFRRRAR